MLYILAYGVFGDMAYRFNVIRMVPELTFPQGSAQLWVFHKQLASGDAFQVFDYIRYGQLRRSCNETMYMIRFADLAEFYGKAFLGCDLIDHCFEISFDLCGQDLTAILDRPYHMVVYIAHTGAVMYKVIFHTYSIAHTEQMFNVIVRIPLGN